MTNIVGQADIVATEDILCGCYERVSKWHPQLIAVNYELSNLIPRVVGLSAGCIVVHSTVHQQQVRLASIYEICPCSMALSSLSVGNAAQCNIVAAMAQHQVSDAFVAVVHIVFHQLKLFNCYQLCPINFVARLDCLLLLADSLPELCDSILTQLFVVCRLLPVIAISGIFHSNHLIQLHTMSHKALDHVPSN